MQKTFTNKYNEDTNGVVHYLGCKKNTASFRPVRQNFIKLYFSSYDRHMDNERLVVSKDKTGSCGTQDQAGSWIMLEFLKLRIRPTMYSMRSGSPSSLLRNWNFEGSNDKMTWDILFRHVNDQTLVPPRYYYASSWPYGIWKLESEPQKFYKYLRIRSTGPNNDGKHSVNVGAMEFYGDLLEPITWTTERIIWIGHHKGTRRISRKKTVIECDFVRLPKELIWKVLSYLRISD